MKAFILVFLIFVGLAPEIQAQQSDAAVVARLRERPPAGYQARPRECLNKPFFVAISPVFGAIAGWFIYTFGIGLFASDHGSVYQKERKQFMLAGALIGLGSALYQVVTNDCIQAAPRRRRP